jgi:hypothetical protein
MMTKAEFHIFRTFQNAVQFFNFIWSIKDLAAKHHRLECKAISHIHLKYFLMIQGSLKDGCSLQPRGSLSCMNMIVN